MPTSTMTTKALKRESASTVANAVERPSLVGRVTQRQLAELANVSMTTIYNCLHAKELVNKKTLEHVQNIMEMYDYHPNSIAKAMVMGKSQSIGIIVPRLDVAYFATIASKIEQLLSINGYSCLICQHLDDTIKEEREIRLMREKRVDGIIIRSCGSRSDASIYKRLSATGLPFVLVDRGFDELDDYLISMDNYEATATLTEYLISGGHRQIGYIGWDFASSRYRGYLHSLQKHGIAVEDDLRVQCATEYSSGYNETHIMMNRLKKDKPTAIVAFNSCTAIAAIEALWDMGLNVPDDVAVVTVGGHEKLKLSKLQLTSVVLPLDAMIREAVMMLYDQIENRNWRRGPILCSGELRIGNTA